MGGFFLRPKATNLDTAHNHINAEAIGVVQVYEDEYIPTTGYTSGTHGIPAAEHRRDPERKEAPSGSPLPSGSWRGAVSKNTPSGFGKGTRAGKTGVRRG